jgi:hypothetical protein
LSEHLRRIKFEIVSPLDEKAREFATNLFCSKASHGHWKPLYVPSPSGDWR